MSTGARKRSGVLAISGCFTKCYRSFGESFDAERIANSQLRSQWCSQPSARLCCCLCVVCEARVAIRRTNYRGGRAAIRFFQRFHSPFPSSAALEKSLFSRPRFSSFVFSDLALFSPFYFTFLKSYHFFLSSVIRMYNSTLEKLDKEKHLIVLQAIMTAL